MKHRIVCFIHKFKFQFEESPKIKPRQVLCPLCLLEEIQKLKEQLNPFVDTKDDRHT